MPQDDFLNDKIKQLDFFGADEPAKGVGKGFVLLGVNCPRAPSASVIIGKCACAAAFDTSG